MTKPVAEIDTLEPPALRPDQPHALSAVEHGSKRIRASRRSGAALSSCIPKKRADRYSAPSSGIRLGAPGMPFDLVQDFVTRQRPVSVCEIGCGNGERLSLLAPLCGRLTGVEKDKAQLAAARSRLSRLAKVRLVEADPISFATDEAFDLVICSGEITAMLGRDEWRPLLARLTGLLAEGGKLALSLPFAPPSSDAALSRGLSPETQPSPWPGLTTAVGALNLVVESLETDPADADGTNTVLATLHRSREPYLLRELGGDDVDLVEELIGPSAFLAKRHWTKSPKEMILAGINKQKYWGLALCDASGRIASYLDYQFRNPDQIEVGFCYTRAESRGQGLLRRLMGLLVLRYFDRAFDISTHELNRAMASIIEAVRFHEEGRIANERINGESSIYYLRPGGTGFPSLWEPD